jgi:CPA2 family monovalent cation:H+ antiporter-2
MDIFTDLAFIFIISIIILILFYRLKIPSIIGFLLAGVIVGPVGLGLVQNTSNIEFLAEVGIIFLLFTIGMEMSIDKMVKSRRLLFFGGGVQVLSTIALVTVLVMFFGYEWQLALFAGMLVSLSSTAIDMKVLQVRKELDTPHGRAALSIHIFQDLAIIPMMLVTPYITGGDNPDTTSAILALLAGIVIIIVVFFTSRNIVPTLLYRAAKIKDQELFVYIVLGTCMLIAYVSNLFGLSLALGAFLAGLIISESEYSTHALYNVLPFKDMFMSFFFVSTGMMFSAAVMIEHLVLVIALVAGVAALKFFTGILAGFAAGLSPSVSVLASFHLAQMSEFSLILGSVGYVSGLLTIDTYQIFIAVTILSMGVSPFLMDFGDRIAPLIGRRLSKRIGAKHNAEIEMECDDIKDHMIVVGYGICGRNIVRSATLANIPYRVIELNPDTVKNERENGISILYGDAGQSEVLVHAGIMTARICVIVIDSPFSTHQAVKMARELNPAVHIIARTHFLGEVSDLLEIGAHEVISEEFETSVEIFSRIMHRYLMPRDEIQTIISEIRSGEYDMYRGMAKVPYTFADAHSIQEDMEIETIRIPPSSVYCDIPLKDTSLRSVYNITVVAIKRDKTVIPVPMGEEKIQAGDIVMVFGNPENIIKAFPSDLDEIQGCPVVLKPSGGNPEV